MGKYDEILSNEEYRKRLREEFEKIDDKYILRWFYRYVMTKLHG